MAVLQCHETKRLVFVLVVLGGGVGWWWLARPILTNTDSGVAVVAVVVVVGVVGVVQVQGRAGSKRNVAIEPRAERRTVGTGHERKKPPQPATSDTRVQRVVGDRQRPRPGVG